MNQQFVDELLQKKKGGPDMKQLIEDDRFKSLFEDKDFVRDKNSTEYKHMKPVSPLFYYICVVDCNKGRFIWWWGKRSKKRFEFSICWRW